MWSVCRRLSQWWLVFILFGVDATLSDGVGFDSTCTVYGKWNVQDSPPLVVEHSAGIMSARLNPMGSQFSISVLGNLCSESLMA